MKSVAHRDYSACTLMANLVMPASLAMSRMCTTRPCCTSLSARHHQAGLRIGVGRLLQLARDLVLVRVVSFQRRPPVLSSVTVAGLSAVPSVECDFGSWILSDCATMYVDDDHQDDEQHQHTSTSGVTLMPLTIAAPAAAAAERAGHVTPPPTCASFASTSWPPCTRLPIDMRVLFEVLALLLEHVVGDDRRQRDEDADRRRDERLGDAAT